MDGSATFTFVAPHLTIGKRVGSYRLSASRARNKRDYQANRPRPRPRKVTSVASRTRTRTRTIKQKPKKTPFPRKRDELKARSLLNKFGNNAKHVSAVNPAFQRCFITAPHRFRLVRIQVYCPGFLRSYKVRSYLLNNLGDLNNF